MAGGISEAVKSFIRRRKFGQVLIRSARRLQLALWKLAHAPVNKPRLSRQELDTLLRGPIHIVSNDFCMYVARVYAHHLKRMGYNVDLTNDLTENWGDDMYILVAAQWFKTVPKHYIFVQLEQMEASTWYSVHFHKVLEHADGILDYNKSNIGFLNRCGLGDIPIQYVPVTILDNDDYQKPGTPRPYDVVFYGSMRHDRRKNAIALLQQHFNVKVLVGVFGEELHNELRKAKIIVNIHDWPKALLETTRLYECLSLGLFVVSEDSSNSGDFPTLRENISWYGEGDWDGMVAQISKWLADDKAREEERALRYARAVKESDIFPECFKAYLEAHE